MWTAPLLLGKEKSRCYNYEVYMTKYCYGVTFVNEL